MATQPTVTDFESLPLNLTIQECAAYTRITRRALYDLVSRRAIPYQKPNGKLTFSKHRIREWLEKSGDEK